MIEKIFAILFIIFSFVIYYYCNDNYNNNLKEYFYCIPYNKEQDPQLPILTRLELNNFEKNYLHFNINYACESKLYTSKQFSIMRKTRK